MSFFNQMHNFLVVFVVFGLWSSLNHFQHKLILRICSSFSIFLGIFSFFSALLFEHLHPLSTISNVVANSLYMLTVSTFLITIAETFIKRNIQMQIIEKFTIIDQLFHTKLNVVIPYAKEKWEIGVWISILLSAEILMDFVSLAKQLSRNYIFNLYFPSVYLSFILFSRLNQVIFFVNLLRTRLILMKDELTQFQHIIMVQSNQFQNHHIGQTNAVHLDNPTNIFSGYDRILLLKQIFGELYSTRELVNSAFGWSLVSIFIQFFVQFTSLCYWSYLSLDDFSDVIMIIGETVPYTTILSFLGFYCSSCLHYVR